MDWGAEGGECFRGCHLKDTHPGGFDVVQKVLRPLGWEMGPTYGGPLLVWRKQPIRQVLCTELVQRSCGHQRLRPTLDGGELMEQLSLQFDWKIVENGARAEGVGNYANYLLRIRPMMAASVPGHQRLL